MLSELSQQTKTEVRSLRIVLEWKGKYSSIEERERIIDWLKYDIAEIVLTILLNEDKKRFDYFLTNQ